jgi:GNAT superfamily N-acetyltransferase
MTHDQAAAAVIIRERRAQDIDACVAALAAVHRTQGYPVRWPADPARWLSPPDIVCASIAATADGRVLGQILVRQTPDQAGAGIAEISRLFLLPEAQGTGLGARLLGTARRWAAERGLGLALEVVETSRSGAIRLYERTGWTYTETVPAPWYDPAEVSVMVRRYILDRP